MKQLYAGLVLTSFALASVQAHADSTTVPAQSPGLSVAITGGVSDFSLPAQPTGVFSSGSGSFTPSDRLNLAGGQIGISADHDLGTFDDLDWGIGLNAFLDIAHGTSSATDSFTGPGIVVIPGYTTPANTSITLTTNGASVSSPATAAVNHTSPGTEAITANIATNVSGGIDSWGVTTQAPDSFALGAVTSLRGVHNGAGAYGAVASTDGGIFIGSGDLTGLSVTTSTTSDLIYTGMDITTSAAGKPGSGNVVQVYGGPSYRYMNDQTSTDTSVDIPEVASADPSNYFPLYSMDRKENVTSHYLGGIFGLNDVQKLPNGMSLDFNGEAGLYYTLSNLSGTESYTVQGGLNTPVPQTTIENANGVNQSADGLAYAVRVGSSVTMPIAPSLDLTLGANIEYLSRVAYAGRSSGNAVSSSSAPYGVTSDNGTTTYNGAGSGNTLIAFGGMWDAGASVSLTGHF